MKKIFWGLALLLAIVFSNNVLAHPGATGPDGCHLNYSNGNYHCHERKTPDPYKTYYYIKYQGDSYGPYSSESSCMNAIKEAKLYGAYCNTSSY
jgi:hypothetical protein